MSDYSDERVKLTKIRKNIHFPGDDEETGLPYLGKEVAGCTSVIKNDAFDLVVDDRTHASLVDAELINWCRTIQPLFPLNASGQGNQFLCALSVALWSTSDGVGVLRRLLFVFISEFAKDLLHARWFQGSTNKNTTDSDFRTFIDMTRGPSEREEVSAGVVDSFPLPLHVFAAANILRRPIVVIGEEEDVFTGLYLPVLWEADDCIKSPLVIARHEGIFYPLIGREAPAVGQKLAEFAVPLVSSNLQPLKMQFLLEAEEAEAHHLLQNYLRITDLNMTRSSDICLILSAKLNYIQLSGNDEPPAETIASSTNAELLQQTIGNGISPSAPSASVVSLNNLSDAERYRGVLFKSEEERDISMLQETCHHPGCHLFVSRFTDPFCWEHVETGRETARQERLGLTRPTDVAEPVDVSVVNERCKEARCPNMASRFIYPYCYEHIDRKTVETVIRRRPPQDQLPSGISVVMEHCNHRNCRNYASQYIYPFCYEHIQDREIIGTKPTSTNRPNIHEEPELSMMVEQCIHPDCHNHASKYTFPVCYEHLDSPHAISRAAASTHVIQLPRPVQRTGVMNGEHNTERASPKAAPQVVEVDKKFEQTMRELEARTKSNVPRCVNDGCTNFGNGRCRGYCHGCYKLLYPI